MKKNKNRLNQKMNKLLFRDRSLYRSRHRWIFGICQGLADYTEISVTVIRIIFFVFFILSGFFPIVLIYLLAAILISPEPMVNFQSDEEKEFYNSYITVRKMSVSRLKRKFDSLENRIRRMESIITAREYDWDRRLESGA